MQPLSKEMFIVILSVSMNFVKMAAVIFFTSRPLIFRGLLGVGAKVLKKHFRVAFVMASGQSSSRASRIERNQSALIPRIEEPPGCKQVMTRPLDTAGMSHVQVRIHVELLQADRAAHQNGMSKVIFASKRTTERYTDCLF